MAIIHQATLEPSKLELLASHLPTRAELEHGVGTGLTQLGAYRFDDPAGEVGIETHVLGTADGRVLHIPLTYRSAEVPDAAPFLVGTLQHSVLGERWVYDACQDPVYVAELLRVIIEGGSHVPLMVETRTGPVEREATTMVLGSGLHDVDAPRDGVATVTREGTDSIVVTGALELVVHHEVGRGDTDGRAHLRGSWPQSGERVLATLR